MTSQPMKPAVMMMQNPSGFTPSPASEIDDSLFALALGSSDRLSGCVHLAVGLVEN
jgi:hypothetical protein